LIDVGLLAGTWVRDQRQVEDSTLERPSVTSDTVRQLEPAQDAIEEVNLVFIDDHISIPCILSTAKGFESLPVGRRGEF
jgi:hypothetical protein